MNAETITPRACATPNCGREVPHAGHNFCSDCLRWVLKTGAPPVLAEPVVLRLHRTNGFTPKVTRTDGLAA